ncbi:hypothetical protein [Erwinia amylovora]|uniref:hypothetical protein n=1 Tax=Erwinia amylovora TaxID=552 RepID=UPI0020BE8A9F|nr:hypothetical protein [Erwinia amylovora]MCK8410893.1 hypothetical protein [Erwinia amylovora]
MNIVNLETKKDDYKKNIKTLNKINFSIKLAENGNPPPKKMMAVWASMMAGFICFLLWHYLKPIHLYFNFFSVLIIIGVVYFLTFKVNTRSDSWSKEIDKLLSSYEPVDKEAYIELQSHTKDYGFDMGYISEWLSKEKSIIYKRLGKKQHFNFINRKL